MKNPFKGLGGKIKSRLDKLKMSGDEKAKMRKNIVDSFGDGCFVGGLTLLGAAVFAPVATIPTLAAAAIFLAAGTTAKYAAGKMKPNGPELEKAIPPAPPAETIPPVVLQPKPAAPDFDRAVKATAKGASRQVSGKFKPNPPIA